VAENLGEQSARGTSARTTHARGTGIDKIVEAAAAINPKIHLIAGGFHLVAAPDDVIAKAVAAVPTGN
jgi:metal-dependent hydrolase (beta-lactamase superfamily II)